MTSLEEIAFWPLKRVGFLKEKTPPPLFYSLGVCLFLLSLFFFLLSVAFSYFWMPAFFHLLFIDVTAVLFILCGIGCLHGFFYFARNLKKHREKIQRIAFAFLFLFMAMVFFFFVQATVLDGFGLNQKEITTQLAFNISSNSSVANFSCEFAFNAKTDQKVYSIACGSPESENLKPLFSHPGEFSTEYYKLTVLPNTQIILKAERLAG